MKTFRSKPLLGQQKFKGYRLQSHNLQLMKITTITYAFTKNLGNYQSQRLEATAEVEPNETPDEALNRLQQWVFDRANQKDESEGVF